jgi:hypothetical protein
MAPQGEQSMKNRRFVALVACALALPVSSARAQTASDNRHFYLAGTTGYAWDQPHGGLTVSAGGAVASRTLFAYLLPLDATFVQGKQNFRYTQQPQYTGDVACLDRQTNQYVGNNKCRAPLSVHWGGAVEANYAPLGTSNSFFVGGGYRTGYASTAYGTVGYIGRATKRAFGLARLSIGSGFAQLAIGGHL